MTYIGKCNNCNKTITDIDVSNNKGYILEDKSCICDKCYFMFYTKVRDYLYANRGANMDQIKKEAGISLKILKLLYANGAIESILTELVKEDEEKAILRAQQESQSKQRQDRLAVLNEMRDAITSDKRPDNREDDNRNKTRFYMHDINNKRR